MDLKDLKNTWDKLESNNQLDENHSGICFGKRTP